MCHLSRACLIRTTYEVPESFAKIFSNEGDGWGFTTNQSGPRANVTNWLGDLKTIWQVGRWEDGWLKDVQGLTWRKWIYIILWRLHSRFSRDMGVAHTHTHLWPTIRPDIPRYQYPKFGCEMLWGQKCQNDPPPTFVKTLRRTCPTFLHQPGSTIQLASQWLRIWAPDMAVGVSRWFQGDGSAMRYYGMIMSLRYIDLSICLHSGRLHPGHWLLYCSISNFSYRFEIGSALLTTSTDTLFPQGSFSDEQILERFRICSELLSKISLVKQSWDQGRDTVVKKAKRNTTFRGLNLKQAWDILRPQRTSTPLEKYRRQVNVLLLGVCPRAPGDIDYGG